LRSGALGRLVDCRAWLLQVTLALAVLPAPRAAADAVAPDPGPGFCASCELQGGIGGTYHFWNTTHGIVIPGTFDFDDQRYEIGAFRFATSQSYFSDHFGGVEHNARPYWGLSAARRFSLFTHRHWRFLIGVGGSYKTEEDILSASHWNFDGQLTFRVTPARTWSIELTMRHWSNAGLKLPNHGQDFATLTFTLWSGARH
jgi:Lipid A 3-O-deacylase (PagL)